jgi:endonuclease/exonuclease/phosphatase family metal-dependent hydrolase
LHRAELPARFQPRDLAALTAKSEVFVSEVYLSSDQKDESLLETGLAVVSWNIWWRYGPWQAREPVLLSALEAEDPDIVCLQEVWEDDAEDQATRFGKALGLHAVYGSASARLGVGFGNAVLSRWPIVASRSISLPDSPGEQDSGSRGALMAEIDGPRGRFSVVSTHLCWRLHESRWRQRQVERLCQFVAGHSLPDFPPLVCGDFNAPPTSDEIRMMTGEAAVPVDGLFFHDAWIVAGDGGPGYTWDQSNSFAGGALEPNRRIDYIFAGDPRPNGAGHVTECRILGTQPTGGVFPSDHFGVAARIRY